MFKKLLLISTVILATALCHSGEEDAVRITTFDLTDGKKIQALRYSSIGTTEFKTYVVIDVEGNRLTVLEKELASRHEDVVPLSKFTAKEREAILKDRAAAAATRSEGEAVTADQKTINSARHREAEAKAALARARSDFLAATNRLADAEATVRNAPIELAKADARYDAAKTELSNQSGTVYYDNVYRTSTSRSDYLRTLMMQAAEDKAKIEAARKEAQEFLKTARDDIKPLGQHVDSAMADLAAAQADSQQAVLNARASAAERSKMHESDMSIRKTPAPPPPPPQAE